MKIEIMLAKLAAEGLKPPPPDPISYAKTEAGYPSVDHSIASEAKPMSFVGRSSGAVFGGKGTRTYQTTVEPVPDTPAFAGYKGHDSALVMEGEDRNDVWDFGPVIASSKPPAELNPLIASSKPPAELNPPTNLATGRNAAIVLAALLGLGGAGYGAYRMLRKKRTKVAADGPLGPTPAPPKLTGGPGGPGGSALPKPPPATPKPPAVTPPAAPPKPPPVTPTPPAGPKPPVVPPVQTPARPAIRQVTTPTPGAVPSPGWTPQASPPPPPAPSPEPAGTADPMGGMLGFLKDIKPEQIGQFMGAMQPVTKGIAGAAGLPGLAAVTDLFRGGANMKTLLAGDPNKPAV